MKPNGEMENIEDALMSMHTGQWFGWGGNHEKIYANLVIHDDSKSKPTEAELNAILSANAAKTYQRKRAVEYPDTATFMEAYTEKEIGGDATKWNAYVTAYNKVRSDNPKP